MIAEFLKERPWNNDLQQFASVASHDLQEPLRKIQMFAGRNIAGKYAAVFEKILSSSSRMKLLITDILNYSRLYAQNIVFTKTDLKQLVNETLEDFKFTIRERSAVIEIGDQPEIDMIAGQIRQVFQNLVSNALKFLKPGVIPKVSITSQRVDWKAFDQEEQRDGDFVEIRIRDNGIGFDNQFSANLFNLFQRLHSKDKFEGTGIGLAITKKIIDKHNGLIRAYSDEGAGAEFTIVLPVHQDYGKIINY
jgi:two-component system, chemotaxis family, CheB/CheR fusion protein